MRNVPSLPKSQKICYNVGCDEPGMAHCSRCKSVWYCGRECQVAHYKGRHKKECGLHIPPSECEYVSAGKNAEHRKYKEVHGHHLGEVVWKDERGRKMTKKAARKGLRKAYRIELLFIRRGDARIAARVMLYAIRK
jgi:hypothetical protein